MSTTFGQVATLETRDESVYTLDFTSGLLPDQVQGLVRSGQSATYCDESGMYIAEPNAPRMHFDHTTGMWGLLREVGSTNRIAHSGYSTQYWSGNPGGIATTTQDAIPSIVPGRMAAHFGLGGGYVFPYKSANAIAYPTDQYTCASIFVKPRVPTARPRLLLHNNVFGANQVVVYDPVTDTVGGESQNSSNAVVGMEKYPGGWRRIFVSAIATSSALSYAPLIWTSVGANGDFYFDGMQVESGVPFPTSFIPTSNAAVVRPTDAGLFASIPNSLLNRTAGTLIADFKFVSTQVQDVSGIVGLSSDGTSSLNGMYIGRYNENNARTGRPRVYVNHPDITNYTVTSVGNLAQGVRAAVALTYDFASQRMDMAHSLGAASYASTTAAVPFNMDALNRVMIGTLYGPTNRYISAHFYRIRYVPRYMPEAELVQEVSR